MSTTDIECERSGLPASMCAHCRGIVEEPRTSGLLIRRFLTASYDGVCAVDSSHQIKAGDDIGEAVEEADIEKRVGWICADCVKAIAG